VVFSPLHQTRLFQTPPWNPLFHPIPDSNRPNDCLHLRLKFILNAGASTNLLHYTAAHNRGFGHWIWHECISQLVVIVSSNHTEQLSNCIRLNESQLQLQFLKKIAVKNFQCRVKDIYIHLQFHNFKDNSVKLLLSFRATYIHTQKTVPR